MATIRYSNSKNMLQMKNLVIIVLLTLSFQASAQKGSSKIVFSDFLKMPPSVLENFGPKHTPTYVTKTSKGLKLGKGLKFAIYGNYSIVVTDAVANMEYQNDYQTFFQIVSKDRKADGSMFVTYCSCGSSTMWTEGDLCKVQEVNGKPDCVGGCIGPENSGKTCSATMVSYPPSGSGASPRSREVSL